ncbi:aldose 1-epimerase family protein [Sphingomonas populi]|uniref:Aldose 1-epimerase family protein n=1 Tax=Sphingomonas populi TaxID=2484750 RepID=A0A4Q6XY60_9SPHN|nr:aldose 1-epimerase family protein [Sphingomonas populi]RZF65390.1 aldose 1-epimerase family protein [Sphingomonas populi]RZF65557.1 aldose 1-epimerase family protein [Sphingomonas populi]
MADLVEITGAGLSAAINPFGAELTHLRDGQGRELMTDADPAFWTGHAPLLFPFVGRLNGDVLRLDGAEYPMKQHGFARRSAFTLVEQDESQVRFRLEDDAGTRAVYPFAFALDAAYAIDGATLTVAITIANRGDAPMPASFGFHPAFAWPLPYGEPRADHRIVFAADEPGTLVALKDGLTASGERPSPLDGRVLHLSDAIFADDALIWDGLASRSVSYGAATGPQLEIAFPDTEKLGIWTKPGAAFVCIEPWHGIADPQGYAGDFRDKPGVFEIAPGAAWTCRMEITLR